MHYGNFPRRKVVSLEANAERNGITMMTIYPSEEQVQFSQGYLKPEYVGGGDLLDC